MGILPKLFTTKNIICKAVHRNQRPDAKFCPNQQESTKCCVVFKLQFMNHIFLQIEKEIRDFLCTYIKVIMSHRNFTNWQIICLSRSSILITFIRCFVSVIV